MKITIHHSPILKFHELKTAYPKLKNLLAFFAIFALSSAMLPVINTKAATNIYLVNDVGDAVYKPTLPQATGLNGTSVKTLRWAFEQLNRNCDEANLDIIQFDWANMKKDGLPLTTIKPEVTEGDGDTPGTYSIGSDKVYRISLNTYLPDLICPNSIIDGETLNPNAAASVGSGNTTGILSDLKVLPKIKRPAIEIMPKASYIRPVNPAFFNNATLEDQFSNTRNCGISLRAETQTITGISIFGFGGGGLNDGNICVTPYSDFAPVTAPDPNTVNAEYDVDRDYFPQVNALGTIWLGSNPIGDQLVSFVDPTQDIAAGGALLIKNSKAPIAGGPGLANYVTQPSVYENGTSAENVSDFNGTVRGVNYTNLNNVNTTDVTIKNNIIGATSTVISPANALFKDKYDPTLAISMRDEIFQSKGAGIYVIGSDLGFINNNIIAFNGGITGTIAKQSSASGIVFDVPSYGTLSTYNEDAPSLNAEGWHIVENEIFMNINNDRGFGGNGIFTNINQNNAPGSLNSGKFLIKNNDLYLNGGSGLRTFVPSVDVIGNRVAKNGQHSDIGVINDVIGTPAGSYSDKVGSFKHGLYMECGDGYVYHNEIFDNVGSAVAVAGGNMYCPNGGQTIAGGNVISENSFYGNGKLGIDLFKENNIAANTDSTNFKNAPSNQLNYEKPIGSEFDNDSVLSNTKSVKYVSLNTDQALETIRKEATTDFAVPAVRTKTVGANLAMPFPIFTKVTQDCTTNQLTLEGYTTKNSVVEIFTPDTAPAAPAFVGQGAQEFDGEGKTYLFDFSDDKSFAAVSGAVDDSTIVKSYTNADVADVPYYDEVTGTVVTLGTRSTNPILPVDKVKKGVTLSGDLAHQFSVKVPASLLKLNQLITATATDYTNDPGEIGVTSEFSPTFLVRPVNPCPKASIVKAWDAGPGVLKYSKDQILNFTITVANESKTDVLGAFNLKDDSFASDPVVDNSTLSCVPSVEPKTPLTAAQLILGYEFKPAVGIPIDSKVEFKCGIKVKQLGAAGTKIINTATLATSKDPNIVVIVVPPTVLKQSDGLQTLPADIPVDSIEAEPNPVTPELSIRKKIITTPNEYAVGDTIEYQIVVTNVTKNLPPVLQIKMIDDCAAATLENCVITSGSGTFDQATSMLTGITWSATNEAIFKVVGKVKAGTTGKITNTAKLDPTVPVDPSKPGDPKPKCVKDIAQTNSTGNLDDCDDDVITPPKGAPILKIRKVITTSPNLYKVGAVLNYDVIVTNTTPLVLVKQIKVTDDCGAGALLPCTVTSGSGTYDATTKILSNVVWSATNEATFKVIGTVKAGTTGDVINKATLDPTLPVDPLKPNDPKATCIKDLAQTNSSANTEDCDDDVKTPTGEAPILQIRKIIKTTPNTYKVGDIIKYEVVVTNANPNIAVKQIKMLDDCGKAMLEACLVKTTAGTYDSVTGMLTAITWSATNDVTFTVEGKVKAGTTGNVVNTAKLDKTVPVDPTIPTLPLPICTKDLAQTNSSANTEDCDDDVTTPPVVVLPTPILSIRKTLASTTTEYKEGDTIKYTITVTNLTPQVLVKQVKMNDDCGAGMLENCIVTSTNGKYDQVTGMLTDIVWSATNTVEFGVVGKVKVGTKGNIVNTAKLDPKVPVDPTNPNNPLPICDKDPKQTNSTGNTNDCDDDVKVPPVPQTPVLSIRKVIKTKPNTYQVGQTLTYEIVVTNINTAVDVKQIKMNDDCGGDMLEMCIVTTNNGKYDALTGMLTDIVWLPTNEVMFTVTGKVKAGTTTDVKNIAKLDPKVPVDPLFPNNPRPTCEKDSKQTNATKNVDNCDDDVITPPNPFVPVTPRTGGSNFDNLSILSIISLALLAIVKIAKRRVRQL